MSGLRWPRRLAHGTSTVDVCGVRSKDLADRRDDFSPVAHPAVDLVRRGLVRHSQKNGVSARGLQQALGFGSYETAWAWLHKLRRAMIRPDRDRLHGVVELDETFLGVSAQVSSVPVRARCPCKSPSSGSDRAGWAASDSPSRADQAPWS